MGLTDGYNAGRKDKVRLAHFGDCLEGMPPAETLLGLPKEKGGGATAANARQKAKRLKGMK